MRDTCASNWQACYGANFTSGDYTGGSCATYMACVRGCGCNTTCLQGCSADSACTSCLSDAQSCSRVACLSSLDTCTNGALDAGHPCSDLANCCAGLPDEQKRNTCDQDVALAVDSLCNASWSTLGCAANDAGAGEGDDATDVSDAALGSDAGDAGSTMDAGAAPDASEAGSPDANANEGDDASAPHDAGGDH
jgi:hypothetical protein